METIDEHLARRFRNIERGRNRVIVNVMTVLKRENNLQSRNLIRPHFLSITFFTLLINDKELIRGGFRLFPKVWSYKGKGELPRDAKGEGRKIRPQIFG